MATNNFNEEDLTDDSDVYMFEGTPSALPGSPSIDASGHLVIPPYSDGTYFPPSPLNPSVMEPDPNNTGPTTDFWTAFPITIDVNGNLYYYGENTGINVRGPAGLSTIHFDELSQEQKEQIRGRAGQNGLNGVNGQDGINGTNGLSAYELWLQENGYDPIEHPIDEFFEYLANIENKLIAEGTGTGSLIINNRGQYNTAPGQSSFASGYGTAAGGAYSSTHGLYTTAGNAYQASFGKFNENKEHSIFEIGYGTSLEHQNIFDIDTNGNILAKGTITDGANNRLDNKVDKINGKGLSTNDFTNTYKDFIDNYQVDTTLDGQSINPISNSAVNAAIEDLALSNGRPQQEQSSANSDYCIGLLFNKNTTTLNKIVYDNNFTWNPSTNILKNTTLINSSNYNNIIALGTGPLTAGANGQILLGQYNNPNANDYIQVGNGITGNLKNIFAVSKTGDITASGNITIEGDIIDGTGNILSNKQDILTYDAEPTEDSDNIVSSGALYDYLLDHGIDPVQGIVIPEIGILEGYITALQTRVTALENALAAIGNPREIADDSYPANIYKYGVDRDQFYIQKIRPVDPEPEEEEENEE